METLKHVKEAILDTARSVVDKVKGQDEREDDVLALLKQDHRLISSLFEQLDTFSKSKDPIAEGLFAQLKLGLEAHARVEEATFYPALNKEDAFLVTKAITAHANIRRMLAELAAIPMDDQGWAAKLSTLKQAVQNHVEEEESKMFKLARRTLSNLQLREMGLVVLREKKDLVATPKQTNN